MSFPLSFKFSCLWVDIVFSVALVDMVIANTIQVVLVFRAISFCRVATMVVAQVKEGLYHDWHSKDVFLPLVIEIFGCVHQQANNFLHQCVNMVWLTKNTCSPRLVVLCAFYKQRVLVALQKTHATFILKCIIVVGKGSFRLTTFIGFLSLFFSNMLLTIRGSSKT